MFWNPGGRCGGWHQPLGLQGACVLPSLQPLPSWGTGRSASGQECEDSKTHTPGYLDEGSIDPTSDKERQILLKKT